MATFGRDGGTTNADIVRSSFGENDDVAIDVDVDSLTSSINNMMSHDLTMSDKCCIFRVPQILKRHNEKAYLPNAFSIGPWHRDNPLMKATEKIKLKYLKGLLSPERCDSSITLEELINAIMEIQKEARECYAGPIEVGVEDFVSIMVIDACFLIELFRKDDDEKLRETDDPIFGMSCMLQYLHHDLILVENQIPWLVLERLFSMTVGRGSKPLSELALNFFQNIFSFKSPPTELLSYHGQKHLLDLLRNWFVLSSGEEEGGQVEWQPMPCATDLEAAGIKFKMGRSTRMLDIKFEDGVLEIPQLLIQETTEVIIRNLISYEQCCPNYTDRITSYAILLDNLINTAKDMDILSKSGIIENWLNPEDATQFFNKLYNDAYVKKYYYLDLHQRVNKHYKRIWPRWRAAFVRNYLGPPWAIVSLIVAAAFLILTILQTVFSILKT